MVTARAVALSLRLATNMSAVVPAPLDMDAIEAHV
jgi:hypothetical protein